MTPPAIHLSQRGAALVRSGHPFVPPTDISRGPDGGEAGDVVHMLDPRGALLGTALWRSDSRIALRVLSREAETLDRALLRGRIGQAAARRRALFHDTFSSYRVVHGEADQLPGLFIDYYGPADAPGAAMPAPGSRSSERSGTRAGAAVLQTSAAAMDAREGEIAQVVAEVLGVSLVVARDDGSARDLDGLPRRKGVLLHVSGDAGTLVRFRDAGTLMETDLLGDGKTGAFLDQQENHACARDYAARFFPEGTALDTFTYHGGFALGLARAGLKVLACDENPQAVLRARHNAELNGLSGQVEVQAHNAFDLLRSLEAAGRRFSVVVIDPPALQKRGHGARGQPGAQQAAQRAALRAYHELNLRGLRLVVPGGLLITCSCSGRLSPAGFGEMLEGAARDVGRQVQVLERRGAGRDHPVLLGVPETEYLKCWVLRVLG